MFSRRTRCQRFIVSGWLLRGYSHDIPIHLAAKNAKNVRTAFLIILFPLTWEDEERLGYSRNTTKQRQIVKNTTPTTMKHAEKPTRPLTAYNLFFHDDKVRLEKECTSGTKLKYTQVAKLVAARWKSLDRDEKNFYEQLAAKDKRRFALEMVQWKLQQEMEAENTTNNVENTSRQASQRSISENIIGRTMNEHCDFPRSIDSSPSPSPCSSSDSLVRFLRCTPEAERKLTMLFQMLSHYFGVPIEFLPKKHDFNDIACWIRKHPLVQQKLRWILQARDKQQKTHRNHDDNDPLRRMVTSTPTDKQMCRTKYERTLDGFKPEDILLLEDLFNITVRR